MGGAAEGGHVKRRMRLCRQRSGNPGNARISSGQRDAVPGFPWPPPVLAEFREVFRVPPKLTMVKPPEDKAR